jgi:hypothetical protein
MATHHKPSTVWRNQPYVLTAVAFVSLVYVFITYRSAMINHESVSALKLFIISCTIALPEIIIWCIATIATLRFKQYAHGIRASADGRAMSLIANALLFMMAYVILLTMAGAAVTLCKNSGHLHLAVTLGDYLPLAVALAAAGYFFAGAIRLNKLVPIRLRQRTRLLLVGTFTVIATLYVWNFHNHVPTLKGHNGIPQFVQSIGVLVYTYAIPYVIVWALGVYACISIANYSRHTKGTIYREMLGNFYRGVLLIFICTFLAQLFVESDVSMERFSFLLFLIYCLLLAAVIGFALIYQASTRLQSLEKV